GRRGPVFRSRISDRIGSLGSPRTRRACGQRSGRWIDRAAVPGFGRPPAAASFERHPMGRAPSAMDKERELARPQISQQAHDVVHTMHLTIARSVDVDPVLPPPLPKSLAPPIAALFPYTTLFRSKGDADQFFAAGSVIASVPSVRQGRAELAAKGADDGSIERLSQASAGRLRPRPSSVTRWVGHHRQWIKSANSPGRKFRSKHTT